MFSSKTDQWATPSETFAELDAEFHFDLDPCADVDNHKCERYFTKEINGLSQNWGGYNVFCNPPYGRQIGEWVKKAYEESRKPNTLVVMLIPARTDTKWFHDYILGKAEIRFIRGRLKFGGADSAAPFPSMVVVFRHKGEKQ
jgi:site-specific DNA-methyltransferase (adenine-specific)